MSTEQKIAEPEVHQATEALVAWLGQFDQVIVAFSGGVDSSVVLAAAIKSEADSVLGITAVSPSVASWQVKLAKEIAVHLHADHRLVETGELDRPDYVANNSRRCFYCKDTLYAAMATVTASVVESSSSDHRRSVIVSGTNADDLGDHRPGIEAGRKAGVQTPLADLGFGKEAVREMAQQLGLPNSQLPASPCLASRIAYGVDVTTERLKMIEQAEAFLRELGQTEFRVRLHEGELARIEVPESQIAELTAPGIRQRVVDTMIGIGFRFVSIDLQGFASGSLNRQLVTLGTPKD